MGKQLARAKILVNGLVQGVGFRYFVLKEALRLGVLGFTQNLYTGEVLTIVEGEKYKVEALFEKIKIGPMHSHVNSYRIEWEDYKGEFDKFEIRY